MLDSAVWETLAFFRRAQARLGPRCEHNAGVHDQVREKIAEMRGRLNAFDRARDDVRLLA